MNKTFVKVAGLLAVASAMGCGTADPFSGTTWTTTTIPATQAMNVTAFSETIGFTTATSSTGTTSTGPATLTFSITNSATASKPGCHEAWTFAGCTWSSDTSGTNPTFSLHSCVGSVARTMCTTATDNQAAMVDSNYDISVNGGTETFVITGSTATATGNSGVAWDGATYTFTKM